MPDKNSVELNNIDQFFNENKSQEIKKENIEKIQEPDYNWIITKIYKEILNRLPDVGGLKNYSQQLRYGLITEDKLRTILMQSNEYINLTDFTKNKFIESSIKTMDSSVSTTINSYTNFNNNKLTYCMMGTNRLHEFKDYIPVALNYVDEFIFIDGGSEDGSVEYFKELSKNPKFKYFQCEWNDKFSEQRNNFLSKVKEGWIVVSDTDEHFPIETLSELRNLITQSNNGINYSGVQFNSEDIIVDDDNRNKVIRRSTSNFWKPLMFRYHPDLHYEGEPHEILVGYPVKWEMSNLKYEHTRSQLKIWTRSTENFFISNSNRRSEKWMEFRFLCTQNKLLSFKDFWKLFEQQKLPKEIEKWIDDHKNDDENAGDSEVREMAKMYFEVLPKRNLVSVNIAYKNKEIPEIIIPLDNYKINIKEENENKNEEKNETKFFFEMLSCEKCNSNENLIKLDIYNERILDEYDVILCENCLLSLAKGINRFFSLSNNIEHFSGEK